MNQLQSKFRGCLVGALVGDCLGAVYEGDQVVSKTVLNRFFTGLKDSNKKGFKHPYTDDTAMTKSLALSLIDKNGFDARDCAQRFTQEYNCSPRRGYGKNVVNIFRSWTKYPDADVFQPGKEQFGGKGSYGNGAAMRVAPVALYCYNDVDKAVKIAKESALLTHTNKEGYNGAILECLAIIQALQMDKSDNNPLDQTQFIDTLIKQMALQEPETDTRTYSLLGVRASTQPYCKQLQVVKELLKRDRIHDESVEDTLGNDVAALTSVPTSIFAFLWAQRNLAELNASNHFARTIQYAISLGGDTDTIASMAGAIAGAYHGVEAIDLLLQEACEGLDVIVDYADKLFAKVVQ